MQKRIEQIMKLYGLNASQFAEKLGVQNSNVSHILSGRNKPSLDFLLKVVGAFKDINLTWLAQGTGNMLNADAKGNDVPYKNVESIKQSKPQTETKIENIDQESHGNQLDLFSQTAKSGDNIKVFNGNGETLENNITSSEYETINHKNSKETIFEEDGISKDNDTVYAESAANEVKNDITSKNSTRKTVINVQKEQLNAEKKAGISKIIVFYDDKTYDEFEKK